MSVSFHKRLLLAPPIITVVYITATDLCVLLLVYTSYSLFLASSRKWNYFLLSDNSTWISLGGTFRQIRTTTTKTMNKLTKSTKNPNNSHDVLKNCQIHTKSQIISIFNGAIWCKCVDKQEVFEIMKLSKPWNARMRTVDQGQKLVYYVILQDKQCSQMVD